MSHHCSRHSRSGRRSGGCCCSCRTLAPSKEWSLLLRGAHSQRLDLPGLHCSPAERWLYRLITSGRGRGRRHPGCIPPEICDTSGHFTSLLLHAFEQRRGLLDHRLRCWRRRCRRRRRSRELGLRRADGRRRGQNGSEKLGQWLRSGQTGGNHGIALGGPSARRRWLSFCPRLPCRHCSNHLLLAPLPLRMLHGSLGLAKPLFHR